MKLRLLQKWFCPCTYSTQRKAATGMRFLPGSIIMEGPRLLARGDRGRAKPRRTGAPNVVARAFKLPNEMVWKVLAFWRVESEVTGEVI